MQDQSNLLQGRYLTDPAGGKYASNEQLAAISSAQVANDRYYGAKRASAARKAQQSTTIQASGSHLNNSYKASSHTYLDKLPPSTYGQVSQ